MLNNARSNRMRHSGVSQFIPTEENFEYIECDGGVTVTQSKRSRRIDLDIVSGANTLSINQGTFHGEQMTIACTTYLAGSVVISANIADTSITFDAANEMAILVWNGSAWDVLYSSGATVT